MQYINIVGGSESMYDAVFGTHSFVVGFALGVLGKIKNFSIAFFS